MDVIHKLGQLENKSNYQWDEVNAFAKSVTAVLQGVINVAEKQDARIAALEAMTKRSGSGRLKKLVVTGVVIYVALEIDRTRQLNKKKGA